MSSTHTKIAFAATAGGANSAPQTYVDLRCHKAGREWNEWRMKIGLSSVLHPRQHSIGYMGDGFYRSKDPTNSIKVLKEKATKENTENANNKIHRRHGTHVENEERARRIKGGVRQVPSFSNSWIHPWVLLCGSGQWLCQWYQLSLHSADYWHTRDETCLVSLFHWAQNFLLSLSTSRLGTCTRRTHCTVNSHLQTIYISCGNFSPQ